MIVGVRLVAGPADGDRSALPQVEAPTAAVEDFPPNLWVSNCKMCKEWHWSSERRNGHERYDRDEVDDDGWLTYVYVDQNLSDGHADLRVEVGSGSYA